MMKNNASKVSMKARKAYQDFFAIWNNAEADLQRDNAIS